MTNRTAYQLSAALDEAMKPLTPAEAHAQLCIANNCVERSSHVVVFGSVTESWGEDEISDAREDQDAVYSSWEL